MSLWPPRREDQAKLDRSLAGASPLGRSGRQTKSGASWSEGLVAGERVPDRVGEPPRDVDLGDLGPALLAEPALVALVALRVGGVLERVDRRLEQRPAQIARAVLGQGPAAVGVSRPADARAEAGVAGELPGLEKRSISPISSTDAVTFPRQGSGTSSFSSSPRPSTPNRSVTGQGRPKLIRVEWIRCLSADLCFTRWRRSG